MKRWLSLLTLAWCTACALFASAHEVRPAYLEIRQAAPDTYDVLWKVPALGDDRRLGIYVRLPVDARNLTEPQGRFAANAYIEKWRVQRAGGLEGQSVHIDGLAVTKIDVLARVERANGLTQTARVLPDSPNFLVEATPTRWKVSTTYLGLGIEHILLGIDHLLFVLALVLLVKGWKRLVGTITAFTLAHSITLAAATLGFVHVPGRPVEACIALSILFVAAENIRGRQGKPGLTERVPWIVAFTFGLLHGLGFAGALNEVGLPPHAIPLALFFFNVGVEVGQLFFIILVLALTLLWRQLARRFAPPIPAWAWRMPSYAVGGVAAFWLIERTISFVE